MGDPPRADKWKWGSLSLRAIAPRADRGELTLSDTFFFTFLNFN